MDKAVGWFFPPTNGGKEDGWNEPGIAHFTGTPLSSVARETIQNSLDGREQDGKPVEVVFELLQVKPDDIGADELGKAIRACARSADALDDSKAKEALEGAQEVLGGSTIPCLRISDTNTTGLLERNWHALVKMQGLSQKGEGSGGSYGIGKYAPFAVSALRTVFYWTHCEDNGRSVEKLQGKAVLMSHDGDGRMQGTGFFGIKAGCEPLQDRIPQYLRHTFRGKPVAGTSLLVMGFNEESQWQRRIASSVIENYFYAIAQGSLRVILEPEEGDDAQEEIEIDHKTLAGWFHKLEDASDQDEEDGSALARAKAYYESTTETPVEKQDPDLGHCKLFIKLGKGLPSRVAMVRRTGMLVTDQQTNLMRFPAHEDFAAMCVFEDPAGNELLRRMESPQHDKFEPRRLPNRADQQRGQRALRRMVKWIRDAVKAAAGPKDGGHRTMLSELATLLPDPYPDEPFDDANDDDTGRSKEKGFGDRIVLKLRPIRPTSSALPKEGPEDDGPGDDVGASGGGSISTNEGSGGTGGSGEGDGQGGSGGQSGGASRRTIPISGVRIIPLSGHHNRYRLSFLSHRSGVARVEIEEAGDSNASPVDDVRAVGRDMLDKVALSAGERVSLEVIADEPIRDRALRVEAVELDG